MKTLPAIALIGCGLILATGTAAGAARKSHVMDVPLPDGSVARVEYVGNVAPRVTIEPAAPAAESDDDWAPLVSLAGFEGMFARMNWEAETMTRAAQQAARQPINGSAPYAASLEDSPAGTSSTTIVSFSSGGQSCTRTTEAISEGRGKPMKVTSKLSGTCASAGSGPARPISPPSHA